jgi:hypothetical protein
VTTRAQKAVEREIERKATLVRETTVRTSITATFLRLYEAPIAHDVAGHRTASGCAPGVLLLELGDVAAERAAAVLRARRINLSQVAIAGRLIGWAILEPALLVLAVGRVDETLAEQIRARTDLPEVRVVTCAANGASARIAVLPMPARSS